MGSGLKDLPYSLETEMSVLGCCLLTKEALYNVVSSLEEDDFFVGKHKKIYQAIKNLMERKSPIDVLTVAEELSNMKELENIGGADYLRQLTESTISFKNLQFYIDIVSDHSVLRKMLLTIRDIDDKYKNEDIDNPNDFILESETKFKASVAKRHVSSFLDAKTIVKRVESILESQQDTSGDDLIGFDTGYPQINNLTQGFQRTEMIVVAARPSVGKTALAMNFAYNVATRCNATVGVFSLEMTAESLIKRLVANVSCVSLKKIQTGHFQGNERAKVAAALKEISNTKLHIDDTNGIRLMDIVAKSRKLQATYPDLGLIVIDYLGLITTSSNSRNPDARHEEVRKISAELKGLAKDLKVPIVIVSQLSRDVEKRGENKKPMMSDLRDSGAVEQDADVIMLLYRDDYYGEHKKTKADNKKGGKLSEADKFNLAKAQKEKELGEAIPGSASYVEVNIVKNRNGATGVVPLFFYKEYGRFDSPSQEWLDAMKDIEEHNTSD